MIFGLDTMPVLEVSNEHQKNLWNRIFQLSRKTDSKATSVLKVLLSITENFYIFTMKCRYIITV